MSTIERKHNFKSDYMRIADLKTLSYKQIQYEFCSKADFLFFFVFTRQQHNVIYDTQTQLLYMYSSNGKILGPDEARTTTHSLSSLITENILRFLTWVTIKDCTGCRHTFVIFFFFYQLFHCQFLVSHWNSLDPSK